MKERHKHMRLCFKMIEKDISKLSSTTDTSRSQLYKDKDLKEHKH